MATSEERPTLYELIERRRERDQPVTIHVEIALEGAEMPAVERIAYEVAEQIASDDGNVVRDGVVEDGDVWVAHLAGTRDQQSVPKGVTSRANRHAGAVLISGAHAIPTSVQKTLDARVQVVDERIDAAHAVRHEPFEKRTYYERIDVGVADGDE